VDPKMNEPSRTRTTRRVVLTKPHRTQRDPGDEAVVWRQRRPAFGISTGVWLLLAVVGALGGWGTTSVALALAAGLLSGAVVVKAYLLVRRAEEGPPAG
jgi:Mrp family chromosome partitioning ATPase